MARQDITTKTAQHIIDGFNRLDLDIERVGALITTSGPAIKAKAMRLALKIVYNLSLDYDYGNFGEDDDHTRACILARKMMDVVDQHDLK